MEGSSMAYDEVPAVEARPRLDLAHPPRLVEAPRLQRIRRTSTVTRLPDRDPL